MAVGKWQPVAGLGWTSLMHNRGMKKLSIVFALFLLALFVLHRQPGTPATSPVAFNDASLLEAIRSRARDVPVEGGGTVLRLLPDDRDGSPHQRFLVRVASGGTVLVAHNLALAARVAPLGEGDVVAFRGEYVWNEKGGVVHWTHPDPAGRHSAGWIRRVP